MKKCLVCQNNSNNRPAGVSFHLVPRDEILRRKWLMAIGLSESDTKKSNCICSSHFLFKDLLLLKIKQPSTIFNAASDFLENQEEERKLPRFFHHMSPPLVPSSKVASGTNKMANEVQVAVLLHCIDEQCVEVYNTLGLTDDEKRHYETVLKKFEDYFVPIKNESVSSHIFFTRNQETGESFDAYLTELKKLSADCNFGTLKDRLIRDRIVAGINDKRVKDRLLRENDLTLEKTIKICKSAELSEQHVKKFEASKDVASINKQSGISKNHKGRAGNNGARVQQKRVTSSSSSNSKLQSATRDSSDSKPEGVCQRCGYTHRYKNCPAYNKDCKNCGKKGHFAKMCVSKDKRSVKVVDVNSENESDDCDEFFAIGLA